MRVLTAIQSHSGKLSKLGRRLVSTTNEPKKTCLYDFHVDRRARMELFAGYLMPIVYRDQSIKSEHMHTRELATVFDVSHMMQVVVRGKKRYDFLERLTVADIKSMKRDKCTLSVFTNENGGIIDDCIISNRDNHLHIVSNAGNADIVWNWLQNNVERGSDVQLDRLDDKGLIAFQGPIAAKILQSIVNSDLSCVEFMNTVDAEVKGIGLCQITRCGYTGEDGFEISVDDSKANPLINLLCSMKQVIPAGLGARDTLRLEASLCLHGHDINDKITPVEAALNWTIHKRRRTEGNFLGSDVVLNQLKNGSKMKRVGLIATSGGPPAREGSKVSDCDNEEELGTVTSGNLAPKLGKNIAMAYLPTKLATEYGRKVRCYVRGEGFEYEITKMPFVRCNYYIKRGS